MASHATSTSRLADIDGMRARRKLAILLLADASFDAIERQLATTRSLATLMRCRSASMSTTHPTCSGGKLVAALSICSARRLRRAAR
jgi:hypothetical protein